MSRETFSKKLNANPDIPFESGTWTPVLWDDSLSSGEGQTYTVQYGTYTKIGNRVLITGRITVNSLGTLTLAQQARIGGLPFTASSTAHSHGSVSFGHGTSLFIQGGSASEVSGTVSPSTDYISLWTWDAGAGAGVNGLNVTNVSAGGDLIFAGHYII